MIKIKQFKSLSIIFLFNQLQSITLECCIARFLPVLKQNARIIAVKIIINQSITAVLRLNLRLSRLNSLDFERLVLHFDASTARN